MRSIGATELVIFEILTLLIPLVLLVVLFFVVRQAVTSGVRRAMSTGGLQAIGGGETGAEEVLDRRYANGEITQEEYLNIRNDITRNANA